MVRKILNFFSKETAALHQAAFLLAGFSILSQLLAFFRDRSLAAVFGAGTALDTYYAAFRIPDFLFVTVASLVSLSVLVPFIVEREKSGREAVREFVDDIFTFFSLLIVAVAVAAYFLLPVFAPKLFKGFSGEALEQVIHLSRILLLSPIFLGLSNLLGSLTQAYNRFLIYAFAPVIYNAAIIFGILVLGKRFGMGIDGVAWGVAIGSLLHMAIQIPYVAKIALIPRPTLSVSLATLKRVLSLSLPRTFTLSLNHIGIIFLVSLASLMAAGSISIYTFSLNISSVPLSIIGVSYSLAAFPTLSRHFSAQNMKAFVEQMSTTVRHIIFWSMPVMVLFVVLRAQIVRVLLGAGNFDWNDTRLTAASLALFALSVVAQSLLLLFVRAFYSAGHTRKPLLINLISTFIVIGCAYGFVKLYYSYPVFGDFISSVLRVGDVPGAVVLMLPLGYSVGTLINILIHWLAFERDFGAFGKDVYHTLWVSMVGAVFVGLGSYAGLQVTAPWFDSTRLWSVFAQGLIAGTAGILIGIGALWLLKSRELSEFSKTLHAKFWKAEAVAENPEIV